MIWKQLSLWEDPKQIILEREKEKSPVPQATSNEEM